MLICHNYPNKLNGRVDNSLGQRIVIICKNYPQNRMITVNIGVCMGRLIVQVDASLKKPQCIGITRVFTIVKITHDMPHQIVQCSEELFICKVEVK